MEYDMNKVKWIRKDGEEITALVVAYDREVGLTVVKDTDRHYYLYCLTGPLSPQWKEGWNKENYYTIYDRAMKTLKTGVFNAAAHLRKSAHITTTGRASQESCPFGQ